MGPVDACGVDVSTVRVAHVSLPVSFWWCCVGWRGCVLVVLSCRVLPVVQSLDEFIYLLLDHGYDDLASIAECNDQELGELTELFSTFESKKSIQTLVETLRQVGIGTVTHAHTRATLGTNRQAMQ